MELKEIKTIVQEIVSDIDKNQKKYTYRKYATFFDKIGMLNRKKYDILTKFERQFKNNNVTFWNGSEQYAHLSDFYKGATITFRKIDESENNNLQKTRIVGKADTPQEIRSVVQTIISEMNKKQSDIISKRYETFFNLIGMSVRRDFQALTNIDKQFKRNHITFWNGKNQYISLADFTKNTTITFKRIEINTNVKRTAKVNYAGTINVSNSEHEFTLYPHQNEAIYKLQKDIIKSNKNPFAGLLVLPTGGGKTLTAAYWIAKNILDKNKKVLWIAHRYELLYQAKKTFAEKLAYKDIFENKQTINFRIISGMDDKPINIRESDDIIFASKDSLNTGFEHLYNNWLKGKTNEIFLVIDEAHHATAKTYRRFINKLKNNVSTFRMLGLTATPTRTAENEQGLLHKVFPDDIVYKTDLRSLIRVGILSEPSFEEVETRENLVQNLSKEQIDKLNKNFDIDSIGQDIANSIAENRRRNDIIVSRYVKNQNKYKQTIVFALNKANVIALNKLFNERGIKSAYVISDIRDAATGVTTSFTKENSDKIDKFRKGLINVLINVNILTEGTDVPNVQSIFLARPTTSTILMTQMIGRGLRGLKAGGTKDAFIVSFIDDWQNKIAWVNPQKLFIEENTDFHDKNNKETNKKILQLISIAKIEEFAILSDKIIEPEIKQELENLDFIKRIPKGIYQFRYIEPSTDKECNCEVLVYDNIESAYKSFIKNLSTFFKNNKLTENLTEDELNILSQKIENEFFSNTEKYPAYRPEDIKDILQYYAIKGVAPSYIELPEREKYDIDKIALDIYNKNLTQQEEPVFVNNLWDNQEFGWQTFFNLDKQNFIREIDLAKRKIKYPESCKHEIAAKPTQTFEERKYENMSLAEIGKTDAEYEKQLRNAVFAKFTDKDGYYFSAQSGYRSKKKLDFQIDHIVPMHNGGKTVLENLQLLTRSENAKKGTK